MTDTKRAFIEAARAAGDAWNNGASAAEVRRLRRTAELARLAHNAAIDHAQELAGIHKVANLI